MIFSTWTALVWKSVCRLRWLTRVNRTGSLGGSNRARRNRRVAVPEALERRILLSAQDVTFSSNTTITESDVSFDGFDLLIDGATVAIDGHHDFNSIQIINGGVLTHTANNGGQTHEIDLDVANEVIVDLTSSIDVSGKGSLGGGNFSGGSYGGLAGTNGFANAVYGDYANPNEPGSGGGDQFHDRTPGGGLIRISAGSLTLDGKVNANGASSSSYGGSGGGVYIAVGTLTGLGTIHADGGFGPFSSGGGGRIAIYTPDLASFDHSSATAYGDGSAGAGTVYFRDTDGQLGLLVINAAAGGNGVTPLGLAGQSTIVIPDAVLVTGANAQVRPEHAGMALSFDSEITVQNGARFVGVDGVLHLVEGIAVGSSASLEVSGALISDSVITVDGALISATDLSAPDMTLLHGGVVSSAASGRIEIQVVGTLWVDETSRIDVTGKGSTGGGNFAGGSYGGLSGTNGFSNPVYGDYANPNELGSGGGDQFHDRTAGGGLIQISAGTLLISGQIASDGASSSAYGGSGGGILISTETLLGTGTIHANGGSGPFSGGGGGRIAIYTPDIASFDHSSVTAYGGGTGGAGTVYVRDTNEQSGLLVIDAGTGGNGVTPLGLPGQSTVSIFDAVFIAGPSTQVRPEHAGMALSFQSLVTVQNNARLVGVDGILELVQGALLKSGAFLEIPGTLRSSELVVVDAATISATNVALSDLSLLDGSVMTSVGIAGLQLEVTGTLSVDVTSRIDVTGKGNTGGGNFEGGSYGGAAGHNGFGNALYGDFADPDQPGSGGGDQFHDRTAGGGLIRMTVGALALDGQIVADGASSSSYGGSGGGISIEAATLSGSGSIHADGGSGPFSGGGGGRIALYAMVFTDFDVSGITAGGGGNGSAGTVHIAQGQRLTHIRSYSPTGQNGIYVPVLSSITLSFNQSIDTANFNPSDFVVTGQMGTIHPTGLTLVGDRTYRLDFPVALSESGFYHFNVLPTLHDAAGMPIDQNANGTGGELDDGYSFDLIVDSIPPRITQHVPAGDFAGTIDHLDVLFSETIDKTTFNSSDIAFIRPDGQVAAVSGIQEVGFNRFQISFSPQTLVGTYRLSIGPDVRDRAGNMLNQDQDGIAGEASDDVYNGTFNIVSVDLGLNGLQIEPAELIAGDPVTITWQGQNQTGAALLGTWIDAVYLSIDDQWDISDRLLTTISHTGGLADGQAYQGSATVIVPGVLAGSYHILVRADVANQEKETQEGNNLISSPVVPLSLHTLPTDGSAVNGTLSTSDRSDYYKFELGTGDSVQLALLSPPGSQLELYVSYAALPTRTAFDQRSVASGNRQQVSLDAINGGGVYYVLVYGAQLAGNPQYSLNATKAPFFANQISPNHYGMAAPAHITVTGTGFDATTAVDFLNSGGTARRVPTQFVSESTLIATIDFSQAAEESGQHSFDWTPGNYTVQVTKGVNTATLPESFTIIAGGAASLQTNLVVPGSVSPSFPIKQTLWIEYQNTGDIAMAAPLLQVSADGNSLLTTDEDLANQIQSLRTIPNGVGGSVQVFGIGNSATPGLLQPSESGRIPVYYVGLSHDSGQGQINFSLSSLSALDTTEKVAYLTGPDERVVFERPGTGVRLIDPSLPVDPLRVVRSNATQTGVISSIGSGGGGGGGGGGVGSVILPPANVFQEYVMIDWNALRAARPSSIPADAWDAILYNVRDNLLDGSLGSDLWADYVTQMSDNANYLATIGQTTSSVSDLWDFEVAAASAALSPVQYLAGSVDASVATPGLPLTFSRTYGEDIASRFRTSTLGRGWTSNWDIHWSADDNGDITLHGPNGVDRFFTRNKDGSYLASPGDYGKLTLANGVFKLVETDQTSWQFRADGNLDVVADPNGNRITLGYTSGLLTSLTHSNGRQLLLTYVSGPGSTKLLSQLTDTMGPGSADDRVTTYQYDAAGEQLVRVTAPGNLVTQYAYTPETDRPFTVLNSKAQAVNIGTVADPRSHALTSIVHADGTHDFFSYDSQGRLIETHQDGGTQRVTFDYVSPGGVKVTDATGKATLLNFGLGGQLVQMRDGAGRIVNLGIDGKFQLSQLSGPGGEQYHYSYDARGNVTGIRDALNLQSSFTYDSTFNQLTGFTDANGNGIDYQYDTHGNLTRISYEDGTNEDFTYNSFGEVLTATNRRSQTLAFGYNSAGQITSKDDLTTAGIDFTYQYDFAGNLIQTTDSTGTTSMTYEPQTDRLARIDYPDSKFFTFAYDSAGRRTQRVDQDGNIENYAYDPIGRLDRMTDGAGTLIVDYDYDSAGRVSRKTLGNGVYTTYVYDTAGNVTDLVNFKPDNSVLSQFIYTYDISGRRTSMTTLEGRFDYGYDALGQLISVKFPDGHSVAYVYDAAGNRRQVIDDGVATDYSVNKLNQYTQVGGVTYTFDADGNLITQTENGVTTTYTYDIDNRLTGVTNPSDAWNYTYDASGNRVASTHNGETTHYVIDPTGLGNVAAEYDDNGSLIARYDYGYGLLSRTDSTGGAFYTFQAIGSTSELTGDNGSVFNSYQYDPFGVSLNKTETVENDFQFAGEFGVMEERNGLAFMRARYYSSSIGRFVTQDPLGLRGGSVNFYNYTSNDPTTRIDPIGLGWVNWGPAGSGGCGTSGGIGDGSNIPEGYGTTNWTAACVEHDQCFSKEGSTVEGCAEALERNMINEGAPKLVALAYRWGVSTAEARSAYERAQMERLAGDPVDPNFRPNPDEFALEINRTPLHISPSQSPNPPGLLKKLFAALFARNRDPNDKITSAGYGEPAYVRQDSALNYTVRFENESDATAPVREVVVTDQLDADLDLDTFQFTEIEFGDQRITVPSGLSSFETEIPLVANGVDILIDVYAALDRETRTVTLTLTAVDPTTGWFPEDPLVGFLYPEDGTGRGQGELHYTVRANAAVSSGTVVDNRASIVFDTNDPIDTPLVHNTLDAAGPMSSVAPLAAEQASNEFTITWGGTDDDGGSGIASYDIYMSDNGSPFFIILDDTTNTSVLLTAELGHTYAFYSVATDNVGHRESLHANADSTTSTPAPPNEPPSLADAAFQVAENSPTSTVVGTVAAFDPDEGDTLTYSIAGGNSSGSFDINPSTGEIMVADPTALDFEVVQQFVLTVEVVDSQGESDSAQVTINLTGVNDNAPVFTSSAAFTVAENVNHVGTVVATDADQPAQFVNFTVTGGADVAWFGIGSDGQLGFTSAPDFEDPHDVGQNNVYNVQVTADDGHGGLTVQEIAVTITPVNDNDPIFTSAADFSIPENVSTVGAMTATDDDLPIQSISFSITGGVDAARFVIANGSTLKFVAAPDFEHPLDVGGNNVYNVQVKASDGNGGIAVRNIEVTVTRVNDNLPVFSSPNSFAMPENQNDVGTVIATDADLPEQFVDYHISGGADAGRFAVDSNGHLIFTSAPDFENPADVGADNVYNVQVTADDGNGGLTTQDITVTVTPVNDNDPIFTSAVDFSVSENVSTVGTLTAIDDDLPIQSISFSITGGIDAALFVITNGNTLKFIAAPDFEHPADAGGNNVYNIQVSASDGNGGIAVRDIQVTVTRVNDNVPVFSSPTSFAVPENQNDVGTIVATDADLPTQFVDYHISGGADANKFAVDSNGHLIFTSAPDFESPADIGADNIYNVRVTADDGNGGLTTQDITVTVTAVNDNEPIFTSPTTYTVPENITTVGALVAHDDDLPAQSISFSISGGADAAKFLIASGNVLKFATAPDFDSPSDAGGNNVYDVQVTANDGSGGVTVRLIEVTVTSVNDNLPVFASPGSFSVAENVNSVGTVVATDADRPAQFVDYRITGGVDAAKFAIDSNGSLVFIAAPDFENPADAGANNIYSVQVTADDGNGGLTSQDITVTVTAVNDHAPRFTSSADFSIPENSLTIGTVSAADDDSPAQTITFHITGGVDAARFTMTAAGLLSFAVAPDFELSDDAGQDHVYDLQVTASDGQGMSTTQAITVTITAVNDNQPVFTSPAAFSVAENSNVVGTVAATDADLPAQVVTFTITGGADALQFAIGSDGQLSFTSAPDFEQSTDVGDDHVFELQMTADDGHGGTTVQNIAVTVVPVNDNLPVFTSPTTFDIQENNSTIGIISATDDDLPLQSVAYSITGGIDAALFVIGSDGALAFASAPDFERPVDANGDHVYELQVTADDGAGGLTVQSIAVTVTPVNDNAPAFTTPATLRVAENSTSVSSVAASDADLPSQQVTFAISGGVDAARFVLGSDGVLVFASAPDFELPADADGNNIYEVQVTADDGSGGITVQKLTVDVTDVDESIPSPQLDIGGITATWIKKRPPIAVLPEVSVTGNADYTGGTLRLNLNVVSTARKRLDQISIPRFSVIGTSMGPQFDGGRMTLQILLTAGASDSTIQSFLRGISFATKGKGLKTLTRTLEISLTDAHGHSASISQTINVRKKP